MNLQADYDQVLLTCETRGELAALSGVLAAPKRYEVNLYGRGDRLRFVLRARPQTVPQTQPRPHRRRLAAASLTAAMADWLHGRASMGACAARLGVSPAFFRGVLLWQCYRDVPRPPGYPTRAEIDRAGGLGRWRSTRS